MKKLVVISAITIALSGCANNVKKEDITVPSTDVVKTSTVVPGTFKAPPEIVRPALPIDQIKPGDETKRPDFVVKAYKASIKALQGYAEQLETVLDGYRKASNTPEMPKTVDVN